MKVLSNRMVDLKEYVNFDPKEIGIRELVYYPTLKAILDENDGASEEELKAALRKNASELVPKHITRDDILTSINYNMHLEEASATTMISTIWATAVSVRSASFCRTSTASACPVWSEWSASVCPPRISRRSLPSP